jgi:hypothetical protein
MRNQPFSSVYNAAHHSRFNAAICLLLCLTLNLHWLTASSGFTAMQGGGINVGYSKNSSATTRSTSATTVTGTTVASIGGDVSIQAGNTYTQTGSDVLTPAGDIELSAKRVDITEARETSVQSACPQADIL